MRRRKMSAKAELLLFLHTSYKTRDQNKPSCVMIDPYINEITDIR